MRRGEVMSGVLLCSLLGVPVLAADADGAAGDGSSRWGQAALESALGYAQRQRSSAVVVVDHGRVIAERYWPVEPDAGSSYANLLWARTEDGAPIEDVASLQKSVVSVLVGIALDHGLLGLDSPVSTYLGPGWTGATRDDESAITIRHLLSMTSGLSPALVVEAPAGTVWKYNTRSYSRLVNVLEAVTGNDITQLTKCWLTDPIGMDDTSWRPRPWVTPGMDANAIGLYTTARDLARFGELMLAGGVWQGRRLVSASYVEAAVTPSQALNPAYGLLWWLNRRPSTTGPEAPGDPLLAPAAPSDMYAAQGALGRKVYVVPSLEVVVVRLGDAPDDDFNQRFWGLLMAAVSTAPEHAGSPTPIADQLSRDRASDGRSIRWREHIIVDPSRGVSDLSGNGGLARVDLDGDGSKTSSRSTSRTRSATANRSGTCASPGSRIRGTAPPPGRVTTSRAANAARMKGGCSGISTVTWTWMRWEPAATASSTTA